MHQLYASLRQGRIINRAHLFARHGTSRRGVAAAPDVGARKALFRERPSERKYVFRETLRRRVAATLLSVPPLVALPSWLLCRDLKALCRRTVIKNVYCRLLVHDETRDCLPRAAAWMISRGYYVSQKVDEKWLALLVWINFLIALKLLPVHIPIWEDSILKERAFFSPPFSFHSSALHSFLLRKIFIISASTVKAQSLPDEYKKPM